jgi:hypothetical protein
MHYQSSMKNKQMAACLPTPALKFPRGSDLYTQTASGGIAKQLLWDLRIWSSRSNSITMQTSKDYDTAKGDNDELK